MKTSLQIGENNTTVNMCIIVCQISAKVLVCARDCHLDSPPSLSTSHDRVVLTYNCKAQCKREICNNMHEKQGIRLSMTLRDPKLIGSDALSACDR